MVSILVWFCVFFKQKTAYEMRISDWSSDVCSSDLTARRIFFEHRAGAWRATARSGPRRSRAARARASFRQISEPARNSVKPETYTPKLLTVFREGYSAATFRADAIAGLTVAIVALPLPMPLGIASAPSPAKARLTAVSAGFLLSALGGACVQVRRPTGPSVA